MNIRGLPLLIYFNFLQVEAERTVSFDNGAEGSIAEDCYFGMRAIMKNYSFGFIDGEMWEKSPFTLCDFIQQRKRWFQGIALVVAAPEIPWRCKIWLAFLLGAWIAMPLGYFNVFIGLIFPLPIPSWLNILCSLVSEE
jgi:egghead protein (zeste-white 4 protein)